MAEAEDVILHAAEQVTATAGALWRRHRLTEESPGIALADVSRRLSVLIQACLGRTWPLLPVNPDAAPTWLARQLRKLPPWADYRHAHAFSDGIHIFLPRYLHVFGDTPSNADLLRLMALMLAVRLGRGSVARCPTHPVARDLFWAVDGSVVEGFLTMEFPGLATAMAAARQFARASRPSLEALKPRERAVEGVVRHLLDTPPGDVRSVCSNAYPALSKPADLAEWADRVVAQPSFCGVGSYRGVAPVAHWGRPRPDLLRPAAANGRRLEGLGQQRSPIRSRQLPHRIEAQETPEDQLNVRDGPFLVPHGDPQQSVEDAAGLRRPLDQGEEPELEALAEELARLGRVPCVESDANVQEILEVEGVRRHRSSSHGAEGVDASRGVAYPEWDYRAGVYRQRYCVLWETEALRGDPQWSARVLHEHQALIHGIRRCFEALRLKRRRDTQQLDGSDLDLDAYVDDFAARHAGCLPADRLYLSDRPRRRDVAVAFLIDVSGSTDAWVSGGQRVLDVEKEATLVFCEALEALGDHSAIYTFASRGACNVHVRRVKGFTDAYGEVVRQRIAGLHPQAYTRMGAPIRHLTAHLTRQRARLRLLFLLSDGKPNDEDEYEGRYGLEDTRQAVAEAQLQGIHLFCLTIDRQGSIYLPQMFGPHGYSILWDITQLPQRLPELYRRLTTARRWSGS
jgi:nitric oxide reductase NorD protein